MFRICAFFALSSLALLPDLAAAAEPILSLEAIDQTVDPCEDFYHYACGNWMKTFELPADQTAYNRQSSGLTQSATEKLGDILASYGRGDYTVKSAAAAKLGTFFNSCMDTVAIETRSPSFVTEQLRALDQIQSDQDLARALAALHLAGVDTLFQFGSGPDLDDSSSTIAQIYQGGMSFSDKSYYFNTDQQSLDTLAKFTAHVKAVFVLAGATSDEATADAAAIVKFETALAEKALSTADSADSSRMDHPTDLAGVKAQVPHFDWDTYLAALTAGTTAKIGKINVATPDFFQALDAILAQNDLANLKLYLKWRVLDTYSPVLATAFATEHFHFWKAYLSGAAAPAPQWKICTQALEDDMRDGLGEAYVNSFPDPTALRANAEAMIKEIKGSFGDDVTTLDWLDAATSQAALLKLAKVKDQVGFPDKWQDYSGLAVVETDYAGNTLNASAFAKQLDLAKIGKPTDRSAWGMPPWEANAYYDPTSNQMVFPLGALVPPIYDPAASNGANFGSIGGGWMGHELTHGFDSDGRHFDGDGNLVNWWTDTTTQAFDQRTQCLVDQANAYQVLPGVYVNGRQTLTENLADQGGVKIGYLAFLKAAQDRAPAPDVGPFNERQQFWVAYAQSWCTKETPASIQLHVNTDVHPPAEFRTNGVLFNRPEFATDFNCKAGSRMVPATRCEVW